MFIIVCGQMVEITDDAEIDHFEGEVGFLKLRSQFHSMLQILGDFNLIWFNNHLHQNRHCHNFVSNAYSQIHMLSRDAFYQVLRSYDTILKRRMTDVGKFSFRMCFVMFTTPS